SVLQADDRAETAECSPDLFEKGHFQNAMRSGGCSVPRNLRGNVMYAAQCYEAQWFLRGPTPSSA
ncbi:Hypothetical predicted protein, partial [Marmota monax]